MDTFIIILGFVISFFVGVCFLLRQRKLNTWVNRFDLYLFFIIVCLWYFAVIPFVVYYNDTKALTK